MKKAQKTPWLFLRFGAAGCAAALALCLSGCGQAGAPSQSLPAFSASQSEEEPQAQSAPSGTQMSEEEIFQLAADLIAQGQTLDDRVAALSLWELDKDDSFTEDLYGHQEIVFYRLLSVQDKAQLRQMLMEVFSEEYTDECCRNSLPRTRCVRCGNGTASCMSAKTGFPARPPAANTRENSH